MSKDPYKNKNGVYIRVTTDKKGKDHVDIYDKDPKDPSHKSIHIGYDSNTGKGSIKDTTNSDKTRTDTNCFLTTACLRCFHENFDDNCYELSILRWFRDNLVSKEDKKHYYEIAPMIVEIINKQEQSNIIYEYIYNNIINYCVKQIEQGNYVQAYNRYKNSILTLEEQFVRPILYQRLVKTLKLGR